MQNCSNHVDKKSKGRKISLEGNLNIEKLGQIFDFFRQGKFIKNEEKDKRLLTSCGTKGVRNELTVQKIDNKWKKKNCVKLDKYEKSSNKHGNWVKQMLESCLEKREKQET